MPSYREARTDSADLTDLQPAEYRADHVTTLVDDHGTPVMSIILEVQLARDEEKPFVWFAYVANLGRRLKCPIVLMVVTLDDAVARWVRERVDFGASKYFTLVVFGPEQVGEITDVDQACALPELAVLSAIVHGKTADTETAVKIGKAALQACAGLSADRSKLFADVVVASLSEAAKREVQKMVVKNWEYSSDWARGYVAEGRAQGEAKGRAEGRADLVRQLLTARFGRIPPDVESRISAASVDELSRIGIRILTAESPEQVFAVR